MEIKKIENCDYVMFPRLQEQGVEFKHVERETFRAELRHVEGHGDYPRDGTHPAGQGRSPLRQHPRLVHRPAEAA